MEAISWQCPQCKSSKIVIVNDYLLCLDCTFREYLYDFRNAYDNPIPTEQEIDLAQLQDRILKLEQISAQPGKIPWQYKKQVESLQGGFVNLRNKLNKSLERKKKRSRYE